MLGAQPRIGLLASPAIRLTGQFERCCDAAGIEIMHPSGADEAAVLAIIRAVKANAVTEGHRQLAYHAAAQGLMTRGAECLVVACTEFRCWKGATAVC